MPMQPAEAVWGAFLTGCRIHGDTELGGSVADRVFELGKVCPGLHMLVSNAYLASGRLQEAARARKILRDRGQKKKQARAGWTKVTGFTRLKLLQENEVLVDLQGLRMELDTQVKVYRDELSDLKKSLNT